MSAVHHPPPEPLPVAPLQLKGAIQRLHGAWDNPIGQEWCVDLPARIAAAEPSAIIYAGRNTLYRFAGPDRPVVVKAFGIGNGLRWRRGRGPDKAAASYDHAARLLRLGLGTPEPLAVIVARRSRAYYVCAWEDGCRSVWDIHDGVLSAEAGVALAQFIARMHDAGAHHQDLTPGNVLLKPLTQDQSAAFDHLLVDCNRMRFGPVSLRTGLAALAKLACRGTLVEPYARARGADLHLAKRIFARVTTIERTTRWFKDSTRPLRRCLGW